MHGGLFFYLVCEAKYAFSASFHYAPTANHVFDR